MSELERNFLLNKSIHFYKLKLEKTNQTNLFENIDVTLKSKVAKFKETHDETDLLQINNKNIFTLVSFDEKHIFGTFGNVSDVIKGDHARGRNRNDLTVEDISNLLEIYTYYYLDIETLNIAFLRNSKLADFKEPFKGFISSHFRISSIFDKISVVPLLSNDIPNLVGRRIPLVSVKATYADDRLPDNEFLGVKEVTGIKNTDIKKVSVDLSLKQGSKKTWKINPFKKENYSEFKLETETESIDLIEGIITKKVSIEVSKDELKNAEIIKTKLQESLIDSF